MHSSLEIQFLNLEIEMMELKIIALQNQIQRLNDWEMWVGKVQDEEDGIIKKELYFVKKNATINILEQRLEKLEQYLSRLIRKSNGNLKYKK